MKKAGVCIIENDLGQFLLLQRNYEPMGFCFPGGKIEENESILDGVIREVYEETNIRFNKPFALIENDFVGKIKSVMTNKKDYKVSIYYKRLFAVFTSSIKLNEENSGYIWTSKPEELNLAGNTDKMFQLFKKVKRMKSDINYNRQEKIKRLLK